MNHVVLYVCDVEFVTCVCVYITCSTNSSRKPLVHQKRIKCVYSLFNCKMYKITTTKIITTKMQQPKVIVHKKNSFVPL